MSERLDNTTLCGNGPPATESDSLHIRCGARIVLAALFYLTIVDHLCSLKFVARLLFKKMSRETWYAKIGAPASSLKIEINGL